MIPLIYIAILLTGCAPSLEKSWDWDDQDETTVELTDTANDSGDSSVQFKLRVDATSREDWVLLDLETGEIFGTEDPSGNMDWDIGIRRFVIQLNCPLNGPEDVSALIVQDDSYDDYEMAPIEGYSQDLEDNNDDGVPEYVFNDWFNYDVETHILTPKDQFYVVRNRNDRFFKLQVENYYSSAGTSAMITLSWAEIFTNEQTN